MPAKITLSSLDSPLRYVVVGPKSYYDFLLDKGVITEEAEHRTHLSNGDYLRDTIVYGDIPARLNKNALALIQFHLNRDDEVGDKPFRKWSYEDCKACVDLSKAYVFFTMDALDLFDPAVWDARKRKPSTPADALASVATRRIVQQAS